MRYLLITLAALLCVPTLALGQNPYSELSAPELRRKIAAVDAIHKENWYRVELVAFARESGISQEYWRLDKRPALDSRHAIQPAASTAATLPEQADRIDQRAASMGAWRIVDNDDVTLAYMAERMAGDGAFRILLETSWYQPVRERSVAFPVYVRGGDAIPVFPEDLEPLDSTTGQSGPEGNPNVTLDGNESLPVELQVDATEPEFQALLRIHLSRYLHIEPDAWYTDTSRDGQRFWVNINQKRRMRSEELHYLDHPLFGLLVRLMPHQTEEQKKLELMESALKAK